MTRREARQWVRDHWAEFIRNADLMSDVPEEVYEVWDDECQKIAARIDPAKKDKT